MISLGPISSLPISTDGVQLLSDVGGIASGEAFGVLTLNLEIQNAGGTASGESFGSPTVSLQIAGAGAISSGEAFGVPTVGAATTLTDAGDIPTAEAFGVPTISEPVPVTGGGGGGWIPIRRIPAPVQFFMAASIPSGEWFGSPDMIRPLLIEPEINVRAEPIAETWVIWHREPVAPPTPTETPNSVDTVVDLLAEDIVMLADFTLIEMEVMDVQ
jgi:hypothetical protein